MKEKGGCGREAERGGKRSSEPHKVRNAHVLKKWMKLKIV